MIYQIIPQFIIYIFAIFVSFYLPGFLLISFLKIKSKLTCILLSHVLGIVMWGIQGYIFGYLNMRWGTYLYIGLACLSCIIYQRHSLVKVYAIFPKIIFTNKITAILISIGIITQLLPVVGSGFHSDAGMRFFGNNAYDGLTHLGFIQSIIDHFPPVEPGSYDIPLRNYHYFSDLVIAELSRIWRIPITLLLFQFIPLLVSFLTGIAGYLLVRSFGGSKKMGNWIVFLSYFAGDGAYIFMLILHKTFGFYTPAIDNGAMQFLNMPNAMAKMIFFAGLITLQYFISSNKKIWGIFSVLFLSPIIGFKVYFGIFSVIGFSFLIVWRLISQFVKSSENNNVRRLVSSLRKELFSFFLLILFVGISLAIYLPSNSSSGGLSYYPLEWPKSFLGAGSIDLKEWWLKKQVYDSTKNYIGIFILDFTAVIIALISIHGTRLLGFFPNPKLLKFLGWEKVLFLVPGLLLFHFLGLYTLQASGGFNVFNFFIVGTVILSLFTSFTLGQISESKKLLAKVFLIVFIVLTIPRVVHEIAYNIENYKTHDDSHLFSNDELLALKYVDVYAPKNAIVQSHPNNEKDNNVGYLSFFSKRLTYLSGVTFLETRNQKISDKKIALKEMFEATNASEFVRLAKDKKIQYIYLQKVPGQRLRFPSDESLLKTIYENKYITIIKPM